MTRTACRLAFAAAVAGMLAGCGGGGGSGGGGTVSVAQAPGAAAPVEASGPSPAPGSAADQDPPPILGGEVAVAPEAGAGPETTERVYADEPQCPHPPPGVELDEAGTPELEAAVQEVARTYDSVRRGESGPYFTGIVVCEPGNFFTVFRVPGSGVFDGSIRTVARRHAVIVHLRDTRYSLAEIEQTRTEVNSRGRILDRAGAPLMSTGPKFRDGGYLEVGVEAKVARARRLLADLGDRVRVVRDGGNEALRAGGANEKPAPAASATVPEDTPAAEGGAGPEPDGAGLDVTELLPPR